jgi:preprotein translocase subunit SecY
MHKSKAMKRMMWIVVALILFISCSTVPKPYYETREGKKKLKHYNAIQFGQRSTMDLPKGR